VRGRFLVIVVVIVVGVVLAGILGSGILSPSIVSQPSTMVTSVVFITSASAVTQSSVGLVLTSAVFRDGGRIPSTYTCDGIGISPPLAWSGTPNGTKSIALIVDDPDAPRGIFTHWVIFNIPATDNSLQENASATGNMPTGATQGSNSGGRIGYTSPCPPSGTHHYLFHLYALDMQLTIRAGATKQDLLTAIAGHILAEAQLTGLYSRS
jgi:hypothetical protein